MARRVVENIVDEVQCEVIRDNEFLEQPGYDEVKALCKIVLGHLVGLVELGYKILCPHYGAHHQFREEGEEEHVVDEFALRHKFTAVHVNSVTQVFEGVEGYTNGQQYIQRVQVGSQKTVAEGDKEVRVLEVEQHPKVDEDAQAEQRLFGTLLFLPVDEVGEGIVCNGRNKHQHHKYAARLVEKV